VRRADQESYRKWCVWVWSWNLDTEEVLAHWGLLPLAAGGGYIHTHMRICVCFCVFVRVCVICACQQMCRPLYFSKRVFLLVTKLCTALCNKFIFHFEDGWWYFVHGATEPSGPGPHHRTGSMITLIHTTLSRTPLYEWSAQRRDLYLTTLSTHKTYQCPKQDSNLRGHWNLQW
jgi:hypothetical protein